MSENEVHDAQDAFWNICMGFENCNSADFTDFSAFTKSDVKDWKIASLLSFLAYHEKETLERIKKSSEKEINDEQWLEKHARFYAVFLGDITINSQNGIFRETRKMFYKKGLHRIYS